MWNSQYPVAMTASPGERTTTGWVPDDNTIGARLILVRQRMRWTNLTYAADACNVAPETWRAWENGTNKEPRNLEKIVAKIARRTGCDAGWLYGGDPLKDRIDLDALEDALGRRLSGPAALALALTRPPDTEVDEQDEVADMRRRLAWFENAFASATADEGESSQVTEGYSEVTERVGLTGTNGTNARPSRPPRPAGRPQTGQTSLTHPKPTRPARLRSGNGQ